MASLTKLPGNVADESDSVEKTPTTTTSEKPSEMELLLQRLPVLNFYFQLHNKIGKGTFSTVYLATPRNSNSTQKYAVKHLTQSVEASRVKYELKCLTEIGGKDNVVPAELCLSNGEDCVTFIMPYLPHLRFSKYVCDMDAEETRLYMKNLFIALRRVHSFNIIHRDVKPDNFLYNRETKEFLLVDFGLAQVVNTSKKETAKEKNVRNKYKKTLVDENIPINYSTKRKRTNSSDDEDKNPSKSIKRIALRLKDNNVKVPGASPDKKPDENKIIPPALEHLMSPIKQWTAKPDADKTPVKSRTFTSAILPSSSRRKLLDFPETPVSKSPEPLNDTNKVARDSNFTPLVPAKSPSANFVQIKNSRIVKQQAIPSTSSIKSPSTSFKLSCPCSGKPAVCSFCMSKKPMVAPRAGTSGFRPPEVLFRYFHQTTAVDMWASGVIMLCILGGCYPFFNSSTDLVALAQIITIFGTERTAKVATKFGRRIVCSESIKGVDLKKLCTRLRARAERKSRKSKNTGDEPRCNDCRQIIRKDGCLCLSDETTEDKKVESEDPCLFPDSAFDLLNRLLDLDPTTRITAAEALEHPFIVGQ